MRKYKKWRVMKSEALVTNLYLSTSNVDKNAWWFWNHEDRVHFENWSHFLPRRCTVFLLYLPITAREFLSMLYTLRATLWDISVFFWMLLLINRASESGVVGRGWGTFWREGETCNLSTCPFYVSFYFLLRL